MSRRNDSAVQPLPYGGQELDRLEGLGKFHLRHTFGHDHDGRRIYSFNRLGFRGGDFDPAAAYRVFAFGESHAFGFFVDFHQCWPSRFVDIWIRHHNLDRRDVCYLNFAEAGSSNASIARSVVSQCSAVRPDLVLVHFAEMRRSEVILNGRPHRIGSWLLQEAAAAQEAPSDGGLQETLLELFERGSSFLRFALGPKSAEWLEPHIDATCLLENLRNILLVQYFCRSEGIRLVATCEQTDQLLSPAARADPTLGPLVKQIDRQVLYDTSIWSVKGDLSDDLGHAGPQRHRRFAQKMFDFCKQAKDAPVSAPVRSGEPALKGSSGDMVRAFYQELPFNHFDSVQAAARSLLANPIPDAYPDLHRLLVDGDVKSVVDCGCGTGWLANTLGRHYGVAVTGVDFTPCALHRAQEIADFLGLDHRVRFVEADLLQLVCDERFDLVISLGALHHTVDPRQAFDHVQRLARVGGTVYVGLYHQPGRGPFLDHFRRILKNDGEEAALAELCRLHSGRRDDEHLRSWFRDQVQHPRETQHTLREVTQWLADAGLELVSTSINRFRPFENIEALFEMEAGYEARSRQALQERRFFPGFFTFLARRAQ